MLKMLRLIMILVISLGWAGQAAAPAAAQDFPPPDAIICTQMGGVFTTDGAGSNICYWIPPLWNQELVVFAHGYVEPRMEVGIPWDQLVLPDGTSLPGIINTLRYAFAVTSYPKNGLVVKEGVNAVFNLVNVFKQSYPITRRVFLTGVSEGGLVTTLAMEKDARSLNRVFSGAISACGPVGDFTRQMAYWGDFRLLFDHYFPNVIPIPPEVSNPAINIAPEVIASWSTPMPQPQPALPGPLQAAVLQALASNPTNALKLIAASQATVDPLNLDASVGLSTLGILGYNILATNEGRQELSGDPLVDLNTNAGSPYDNIGRVFYDPDGTLIDLPDYAIDPAALYEIGLNYTTNGYIRAPVVGLHTLGDPIVPYWHELIYRAKTLKSGTTLRFLNIAVRRYGHCNFKASEAVFAFIVMIFRATYTTLSNDLVQQALPDAEAQAEYQVLLEGNSELLKLQIYIPFIQR
jgi:hypothetical protein